MKHNYLMSIFALALAALGGCAATGSSSGDGSIALKGVRGIHVGGERVRLSGLPLREVRTKIGRASCRERVWRYV